jgi:hypothetical protein
VGTVARKRIVFSNHAARALKHKRQTGVNEWDVYSACVIASEILTQGVPEPLKLRNFKSKKGVLFDIVIVDCDGELKVVTVIGRRKSVNRQLKQMGRARRAK